MGRTHSSFTCTKCNKNTESQVSFILLWILLMRRTYTASTFKNSFIHLNEMGDLYHVTLNLYHIYHTLLKY